MSSNIDDYETYKLIYPIFDEIKQVYIQNNNIDMYTNIEIWQSFLNKFYYLASKEKYNYFIKDVLKNQNFINNFHKFLKKEKHEIENEIKNIKSFYRNSYILFLLSLR